MVQFIIDSLLQFRSHSHEQILHKSNHQRTNSNQSIDVFKLTLPQMNDSAFSSLICSICLSPMIKPTLLPCQHTFCYRCIENQQQIRPGSLPEQSSQTCLFNEKNSMKIITCPKCSRTHRLNSLSDLEENHSTEFLINTLLCETCQKLCTFNQLDTCLHCFAVLCPDCYETHCQNHQTSSSSMNKQPSLPDSQIPRAQSLTNDKILPQTSSLDSTPVNEPKKKSRSFLDKFANRSRTRPSNENRRKHLRRQNKEELRIELDSSIKTDLSSSTTPITPISRFRNLHEQYAHTVEHIKQSKQRQTELDQSVEKLIEILTRKTNENIQQISSYWLYLKEILLERSQPVNERFPLIDYFFKTCCSSNNSRKSMQTFFQQNDDLNAAIDVLLTTLKIINQQPISLVINQLFYREEQTTIRALQRQLESLHSSYTEELSFIIERIRVYETRFDSWKNTNTNELDSIAYEWTQIIENDYPALIEKISNDFITKVPQVDKVLLQMLRNTKKNLIHINRRPSLRRTSNI